ncbi:MAG: hypothetical protein HY529_01470 [Chloroflexi bacterium]|nr:hypothetical protein [Chloroflexota bacterium]
MLAHFLEEEGIPTTQISLIRLHTEKTKPPRALWVPFDLGRPLGAPNHPALQKQVLLAALKLLEARNGPALVDFPEDAPLSSEEPVILACPYIPPTEQKGVATKMQKLCHNFKAEMTAMRPWYDRGVDMRKRTTVGVSKLSLEKLAGFICSIIEEGKLENPRPDVPLSFELRYVADDLKAYYYEAVTAQPGMETTDSEALAKWFWKDTVAGEALLVVSEACSKSLDESVQRVARVSIVPREFTPRT